MVVLTTLLLVLTIVHCIEWQSKEQESAYHSTAETSRSYGAEDDFRNITPVYTEVRHPEGGTSFGHYLAPAGDLNGDGTTDLLQWRVAHNEYLYELPGSKDRDFDPSHIKQYSGIMWFLPVGDINGDGYDDVVYSSNEGTANPYDNPIPALPITYYVRYGSSDGLSQTNDDALVISPEHSNGSRWVLITFKAAGDVNGDGYNDLLLWVTDQDPIHHYTEPNYPQELQIFFGSPSGFGSSPGFSADLTHSSDNWTNLRVSMHGDFNGDGCSDLLLEFRNITSIEGLRISQPTREIRIHYGSKAGPSISSDLQIVGNQSEEYVYRYAIMNYNTDEFDDLVLTRVLNQEEDWFNRTWDLIVYNGSKDGLQGPWIVEAAGEYPLLFSSTRLDLDGDGADDFVTCYTDRIPKSMEDGLPDYRYVTHMNLHLKFHFNRNGQFESEPDVEYSLWNVSPYPSGLPMYFGDYDGDGCQDLSIGVGGIVTGAPSNNGQMLSWPGPTFIFFGSGITSLRDPIEPPRDSRLFAGLEHYEFVVREDPRGYGPSDEVRLTLDPDDANVSLCWKRRAPEGASWIVEQGSEIVDLNSSEVDVIEGAPNAPGYLRFKVMFDWDWPHEDTCRVQVRYTNATGYSYTIDSEDTFSIENDITFTGKIQASGEHQGPVTNGSWVRGGELVTLSGPTVVYQGTTDVHPPAGTCEVVVYDTLKSNVRVPSRSGEPIAVHFRVASTTHLDEVLTMALQALPGTSHGPSPLEFHVNIDASPPRLRKPMPDGDEWLSTNHVMVGITADDTGTSGVDGSTLEFSLRGSIPYGEWSRSQVETTPNGPVVDGMATLDLPDGDQYYIRWRVRDLVGNEFVMPNEVRVRIDTRNVTFTDPVPPDDMWHNVSRLMAGVTITDVQGSGIDITTVEYRISHGNLSAYGAWHRYEGQHTSQREVVARITDDFGEGPYNYVQWRAADIAGNGLTASAHFRVLVDTLAPSFRDLGPTGLQNTSEVEVTIVVDDGDLGCGIDPDTVEYRVRSGEGFYGPWREAEVTPFQVVTGEWPRTTVTEDGRRCHVTAPVSGLEEGWNNHVQFRASDLLGNGPALSTDFVLGVDTTGPSIFNTTPLPEEVQPNPEVAVSIELLDTLSGVDIDGVQYRFGTNGRDSLGEWMRMPVSPFEGHYQGTVAIHLDRGGSNYVQFRARDRVGNVNETAVLPVPVNMLPRAFIQWPVDGGELTDREPVELSAVGTSDPEGDEIIIEWYVEGQEGPVAKGEITSVKLRPGLYNLTLVARDPYGGEDRASVTFTVVHEEVDSWSLPGLALLVLVVVVFALVVIMLWLRARQGEDATD